MPGQDARRRWWNSIGPLRRVLIGALAAAGLLGLSTAWAGPVAAHANLVRAVPPAGESVSDPPDVVFAEFSEPIDPAFSRIDVLNSAGERVTAGPSEADPTSDAGLLVRVPDLSDGSYVVAWRTLSTVDGHLIRGSYSFAVGTPVVEVSAAPAPPLNSTAEPFIRWLLFGSLAILLAGPVHELAVRAPALRRLGGDVRAPVLPTRGHTPRLLVVAGLVALAAQLGLLAIQAGTLADAQGLLTGLGAALDLNPWATVWKARTLLVAASLLIVVAPHRLPGLPDRMLQSGPRRLTLIAPAAAALVTLSLGSHAAALRDVTAGVVVADILHVLAAGVWGGGLVVLLATLLEVRNALPQDQRRAVYAHLAARFSAIALLAVGVLAATGAYSAWINVQEFGRLTTPYGLALLGKIALAAVLVGLGAINLLITRRRLAGRGTSAAGGVRLLPRLVAAEAAVVTLVFLATGFLTSLEPARQAVLSDRGQVEARARVAELSLKLAIRPGRPGPNTISLAADGGAGLDTAEVELHVKYLGEDLGTTVLRPQREASGVYAVNSDVLALAGGWQLVAVVRRPGAFDVRAPFRVQLGGPDAAAAASGAPDPLQAQRLWAVLVVAFGLVFAIGSLPDTTWPRPVQRAVTGTGFLGMLAGFALLIQVAAAPAGDGFGATNPIPPDEASIARGRALFEQNCAQCHGVGGRGDGPLAATLDPAPLDLTVHVPLHPDADLLRFVQRGIGGTAMPAFLDRLSSTDIWHVINWLQTLPG